MQGGGGDHHLEEAGRGLWQDSEDQEVIGLGSSGLENNDDVTPYLILYYDYFEIMSFFETFRENKIGYFARIPLIIVFYCISSAPKLVLI